MNQVEIEALSRAHQLFTGVGPSLKLDAGIAPYHDLFGHTAGISVGGGRYQAAAQQGRAAMHSAARTDAELSAIINAARGDHAHAHDLTASVVHQARVDAVSAATPLAHREALRRRVARLRAQRAHVLAAQSQAGRRGEALRALRYRMSHHRRRGGTPSGRAAVAVRAALSRLGRPYVWGATGPDQFDCSGLVQWAYAQAGVHLDRTTYQQINDGIPIPRAQVRPGDLVFPHAGHVQLALGNNLVVEAPYSGASVRISRLGSNVQIRRPV